MTRLPLFVGIVALLAATIAPAPVFAWPTLSAYGHVQPTAAPPANCTICVIPFAGRLTGVSGSLSGSLKLSGTYTEYTNTIVGNGAHGPCLHVTADVTGTTADNESKLHFLAEGTNCADGPGPTFTGTQTYVILGGSGIFAHVQGVGAFSTHTFADNTIEFSMQGSF